MMFVAAIARHSLGACPIWDFKRIAETGLFQAARQYLWRSNHA